MGRRSAPRTSSRWGSGAVSPSRRCSPWSRGCSCSTSRRPTSTRARAASCSRPRRVGRTMLVVTHDLPFAAQLCERAVVCRRAASSPTARAGRPRRRGAAGRARPRAAAGFDPALLAAGRLPPRPDLYTPAHGRRRDAPPVRLDGGGHDPQVAQVRRRRGLPRGRAGRDRDRQGQHDVRGRPGRHAEDRRPGGRHAGGRRARSRRSASGGERATAPAAASASSESRGGRRRGRRRRGRARPPRPPRPSAEAARSATTSPTAPSEPGRTSAPATEG